MKDTGCLSYGWRASSAEQKVPQRLDLLPRLRRSRFEHSSRCEEAEQMKKERAAAGRKGRKSEADAPWWNRVLPSFASLVLAKYLTFLLLWISFFFSFLLAAPLPSHLYLFASAQHIPAFPLFPLSPLLLPSSPPPHRMSAQKIVQAPADDGSKKKAPVAPAPTEETNLDLLEEDDEFEEFPAESQ